MSLDETLRATEKHAGYFDDHGWKELGDGQPVLHGILHGAARRDELSA
jgi:hypothetical protein